MGWASEGGDVLYNAEEYRNAFWRETLAEGEGSVNLFDWTNDVLNHSDEVPYDRVVNYKVLAKGAHSDEQSGISLSISQQPVEEDCAQNNGEC